MIDIFVSYRTVDARFGAAATYELLASRFGAERIFLDNRSIPPGSRYPQRLRDALESMRVLLALIGPQWLAVDPRSPGRPLLHRADDWVHRELRSAFARGVPVVPVLLDGSPLPDPDVLPPDVRDLVHCQTMEIRHRDLGADVRRLGDAVATLLAEGRQAMDVPDAGERCLRVRDADDPVLLGVHPSPIRAVATADLSPKVPAYVPRDVTEHLAWALTAAPFVLIVGDATAGKTRLAYETVRQLLPDHRLVVPDQPAHLPELADAAGDRVIWLDDLERCLGPNGLTADVVAALTRRNGGHTVLLGTIRSQEHARLSPRWEHDAEAPGQLWSRHGRDVVRLAYEIHLGRRWSDAEIGRALDSTDPRVTEAARHADEFGIAEYLAAGPQLLAEWRDAWSPGNHPRGAALVAAAVDVCRAGVRRGVGVDLLRRLHGHHLAARGGSALRPEPFDSALAWATEALHATSSLLVPVGRDRYRPFGYLIDAAETDPCQPDVPANTWQVLIARMPAHDCWHIGQAAYLGRHLDHALAAFERAAAAGNTAAELRVADCVGESGRRGDALAAIQDIVAARTSSNGARHHTTLEARQALANWSGRAGDVRGATTLLAETVRDLTATVGTAHPDTLSARHDLANWLGRAGRLDDAIEAFRGLVVDRTHYHGPAHPDTLAARHDLANWLGRAGKFDDALGGHEAVTAARIRVLGADHPDTLRGRHRLTRLVCQVRGTDVGLPLLAQVVVDRARVLGPDHPDTLRSRWQYVRWTGKSGRIHEAITLAEQLVADTALAVGAAHPDTFRARHQHARWIADAGDHARAATLLRELVTDWEDLLGRRHPYTLISRYRLVRAVRDTGAGAPAAALCAELLADDIAALGPDHPYTADSRALLRELTERAGQ